jgi:CheY-like chemotaxis protein
MQSNQRSDAKSRLSPSIDSGLARKSQFPLPSNTRFARLKMLIVEDNSHVRRLISVLAVNAGMEVHQAATGEEAVALLAENRGRLDLVMTDLKLPGSISGLDVASHCNQEFPHIRILLCSGFAPACTPELPEYTEFLPKPFTAEDLHSKLQTLFPSL